MTVVFSWPLFHRLLASTVGTEKSAFSLFSFASQLSFFLLHLLESFMFDILQVQLEVFVVDFFLLNDTTILCFLILSSHHYEKLSTAILK